MEKLSLALQMIEFEGVKTEIKDSFSTKTVAVRIICIMMYDDNLENSTAFWEGTDKVKVKFTLEQAMKAQRGSRCTAVLFL